MSIAQRSATSDASAAGTVAPALPTGTLVGDVLVIGLGIAGGTGTVITAPNGWTKVTAASLDITTTESLQVYWAVHSAGLSRSFTYTPTTNNVQAVLNAYTGVDTSTPVNVASASSNTSNTTSLPVPALTTTKAGDYEINFMAWHNVTQTIAAPGGFTVDIQKIGVATCSVALGHNNTNPVSNPASVTYTLSATNSSKIGASVALAAAVAFVPYNPTSDWGFWDTAAPWTTFVLQPRTFTPVIQQVAAVVVTQPPKPAYDFWPQTFDWVNVAASRAPPPNGPAPYPNIAARPATDENWYFWPGYEAWYQIQPSPKSPVVVSGPAPYLNTQPATDQNYRFWSNEYPLQPRTLFQPLPSSELPDFVPSSPTVWTFPETDPVWQQPTVRSPFAQSGPRPYPNTAPPPHRPDYDYWPTYDWAYVQPPTRSPFAKTGPAPYPKMAPVAAPRAYDWPLPDIQQPKLSAVVVVVAQAFVPSAKAAQYDYTPDPTPQRTPVQSPFARSGPAPYPNYAARRATYPQWEPWPTYDWSHAQPTPKVTLAPVAPPSYTPKPVTRAYDYWPTYDWAGAQPAVKSPFATKTAETFVPFARAAQYADYLAIVPQSTVVKSPFAQNGPTPYPNYAARVATRQDFDEWPGYEAWYRIQPPPKSPFAPSGPARYPNMAPPARRPDFDEWPVYDWTHVQPPTKSPFAPKGPANYPNYAAQRPTQPQWAPWPTYDWFYVQPPIKSPFAEAGPAPIGSWVASAQDKSDWHFWTAHLRYDWYCRSTAPGAAVIFNFIPGNAYSRYDVVPLAASQVDLAGHSSSRVDRTQQASSQALCTQQAASTVDVTQGSSSRVDTD